MLANFSWVRDGRVAGMGFPYGAPWGALRDAGVAAILTLTEQPLDIAPADGGFESLHVPLVDFGTPELTQLHECVAWIESQLEADRPVAVHCMAGVGRTGTVIAAWLTRQGLSADEAISELRAARPGSVETGGQVDAVRRFAAQGDA
jgi:atypical dual specificity phosphatase